MAQSELATEEKQGVWRVSDALLRRLPLPLTFVKFLIVGGIGFLINQSVLFLLYDTPAAWFLPGKDTSFHFGLFRHDDIRLLIASVAAVESAIVFQFNAHERWTFRHRSRHGWAPFRFLKFNTTAAASPIIVVVTINVLALLFGVSPYISNIIGTTIGFSANWMFNTMFIWPHKKAYSPAVHPDL